MFNWITKRLENKSRKKFGGIPIAWITYTPELKGKNVIFNLHPTIKHDEFLNEKFDDIANYIRENYAKM